MMQNNSKFSRRIRQHIIAQEHDFFAVVQPGFEETGKRELQGLGIPVTGVHEGGIEFRSRLDGCYLANLCGRGISRVLMRISAFRARHFDELRKSSAKIPWELYLADGAPLQYHVTSSGSALYHTGRIEEECRKGVEERLSEYGLAAGTPADGEIPQTVFVRIEQNRCDVSLDSSGELLYRRGERTHVTRTPLRETLAALILMEAGVKDYRLIIDPMCGSGIFSLEGTEMLMNLPAGRNRAFAFMQWPCFSEPAFLHLKKKHGPIIPGPMDSGEILAYASDIDPRAVDAAKKNFEAAGVSPYIEVKECDFFQERIMVPAGKRCLIALNPPYGARTAADSESIYRLAGRRIRDWYGECGYAIITPSLEHEKIMSLGYDKKVLFTNGGLKVALIIRFAP